MSKYTLVIELILVLTLSACASINSTDPDYADRERCYRITYQSKQLFGSYYNERVNACVKSIKYERQEKLKKKQARSKRQEAAKHKAAIEREKETKEHLARVKVLRKQCGNDFNRIRIGMTLTSLKKCWPFFSRFHLTSQINRSDGVLSTYKTHSAFIDICSEITKLGPCAFYVIDNKIVGWE